MQYYENAVYTNPTLQLWSQLTSISKQFSIIFIIILPIFDDCARQQYRTKIQRLGILAFYRHATASAE